MVAAVKGQVRASIPPRWGVCMVIRSKSTDAETVLAPYMDTDDPTQADAWREHLGGRVIRVCGCGCKESMEGRHVRAVCVDEKHRARAWKALTGYGLPGGRTVRANGRPRRDPTMTIRVGPDDHQLARELADREGVTLRVLMERLVRAHAVEMRG